MKTLDDLITGAASDAAELADKAKRYKMQLERGQQTPQSYAKLILDLKSQAVEYHKAAVENRREASAEALQILISILEKAL